MTDLPFLFPLFILIALGTGSAIFYTLYQAIRHIRIARELGFANGYEAGVQASCEALCSICRGVVHEYTRTPFRELNARGITKWIHDKKGGDSKDTVICDANQLLNYRRKLND